MDILNRKKLQELAQNQQYPCVSLLMPTHRTAPDKNGDPITFKNLLKDIKQALGDEAELLAPLEKLAEDRDFWNYQSYGLAIYINPERINVFQVPITLPAIAIVADSFHIKPLYRYFQDNQPFQLLAISQDDVKLYQGDRYHLEPVELAGNVPLTMEEALGSELTDNHLNTAFSTGNGSRKQANQGTGNVVHGYQEKSNEQQNDAERFFRIVDKSIYEHYTKPTNLPLILASLPEHQTIFRKQSKNPHLMAEGINQNTRNLSAEKLSELAWELIAPQHEQQIQKLLDHQQAAEQVGRSHWELSEVVKDALDGKIETLLIEEDRMILGKIISAERRIQFPTVDAEELFDDLLDDLAAMVVEKSGSIMVLQKEQMPHQTGAVSINRF